MIRTELHQHARTLYNSCVELLGKGQSEYAGGEEVFGNFNRLSNILDLDRKQILMVYFQKHIDGIVSYIKGHRSQRESVHGRIQDAIVYLTLLDAMICESEQQEKQPAFPEIDKEAFLRK